MTVKTRLCIQFESAQLTKITNSRISYNIQTLIKFNLKMNECKSDYFVDKYTASDRWEMKAKPRPSSSACLTALPNIINLTHRTLGMRLWWTRFWGLKGRGCVCGRVANYVERVGIVGLTYTNLAFLPVSTQSLGPLIR